MKTLDSLLLLSLLLFMGLYSCDHIYDDLDKKSSSEVTRSDCSDIGCTEQYEHIVVKLLHEDGTPVALDDYKVIRISDGRDITVKDESAFPLAQQWSTYTITNDSYRAEFQDKQVEVEFTGFIANKVVVQERYIIGADCCHVTYYSGNLNVVISEHKTSSVLLLKIDYLTNTFEGGAEIKLSRPVSNTDILPVIVDYKSPGDFGYIKLYYEPSDEMIFNGDIIWMGEGELKYPKTFKYADQFDRIITCAAIMPFSTNKVQPINMRVLPSMYPQELEDFMPIYNDIRNLKILEEYKSENKIGLLLYTPCVGIGDLAHWDWYMMFFK